MNFGVERGGSHSQPWRALYNIVVGCCTRRAY